MPKINILPKHLAELIAAGEVVERPSSVVKELMENSIDAGATKITVEIKNGGVRYIRITDDGCGIDREDIRAAFISHATSKIKVQEDLDSIFTLGFRGEALASVAAVSHIEMLTKTAESDVGTRYLISGGTEEEIDDAGCPDGTTIIIRDLFYNTPARMKFLKKDITEGNYVTEAVQRIALSHPEVSITLIKDNRRTLFTPGDGRLLTVITEVFGKEFASGLIEAEGGTDAIKVRGYISKPVFARANRSMQHCFVNGRYVKLPVSASALDNAYKNRIMVGKYPSCVLFLTVDPRTVDVNVHPAKTQVRFASEKNVYDAVYFTAVGALDKKDTPVAVKPQIKNTQPLFTEKTPVRQVEMPQEKISLSIDVPKPVKTEKPPVAPVHTSVKPEAVPKTTYTLNQTDFYYKNEKTDDESLDEILLSNPTKTVKEEITLPKMETVPEIKEAEPEKEDKITPIRVIGEVFGTYILIEQDNKLLFMDKHAAHERIIFNSLKKRDRKIYSQLLLAPITVTLGARDYAAVMNNLDIFEKSGYCVEDFGEGTVIVRECPTELSDSDIRAVVEEMADKLACDSSNPEPEKLEWLYHSTACRAAVKAGDNLTVTEMESLAKQVLFDDEVRYCPHGRPVLLTMSEYEIKKLFGRNG
ncbi:MAG: DNA mismatch repair endonuclease MutL [Clostridia bacterium]|nr:DNA mismatch repair endonuclease MutL [Clostridia bacterium]